MQRLVATGHDVRKIGHALGLQDGGSITPERFTGSVANDKKMVDAMTVEQRKLYYRAQKEHADIVRRFRQIVGAAPATPG